MADTKITALAAITTVDPAADVLPIVDISDTSMAASGTTKKITSNQILGAGGTATLASATITGALTANGGVNLANATAINFGGLLTIYSDTAAGLFIRGRTVTGTTFQTQDGTNPLLNISNSGIFTFGDGAGGTRMTLNATGLGVGVSPNRKLHIGGTGNQVLRVETITSGDPSINLLASGINDCSIVYDRTNNYMRFDVSAVTGAMILGPTGNVGIGVTPSYNLHLAGNDPTLAINAANQSISSVSKLLYRNKDGNGNTYSTAGVYCETAGNGGYGNLVFYSAFNNGLVERLRMDSVGNSIFTPSATPPTLSTNGQFVFNMTSNTNLRFSYRGSDGTTRVANITLA